MGELETQTPTEMLSLLRTCQQIWTRLRGRVKEETVRDVNRREIVDDVAQHVHGYLADDRQIIHSYFGDPGVTADLDGDIRRALGADRAAARTRKVSGLAGRRGVRGFRQLEHHVFDRNFGVANGVPLPAHDSHLPAPPITRCRRRQWQSESECSSFTVTTKQPSRASARFLEHLGLKPIILHEQANRGRTIIEKVELNSDVRLAVVLLTPDDVGAAKAQAGTLSSTSAENVVFEWGYLIAKLGARMFVPCAVTGVELPSDLQGVVYTDLDPRGLGRRNSRRATRGKHADRHEPPGLVTADTRGRV